MTEDRTSGVGVYSRVQDISSTSQEVFEVFFYFYFKIDRKKRRS